MGTQRLIPLWTDSSIWTDLAIKNRGSLDDDLQCDVAIIGAGYSGLWTAFYLKTLSPDLRICVLEKQTVGFGASSRNGGWCSGFLPVSLGELAQTHGKSAAIETYREAFQTLDEIENFLSDHQLDVDYHRGGTITGATNAVQKDRIENELSEMRSFGFGEEHSRILSSKELSTRLNIDGLTTASYTPHCAAIHPAKLVTGLARVVEQLGVKIFENSAVVEYSSGQIKTESNVCSAPIIVRATEGFTARIKNHRRTMAPLYSYMVATAPLSSSQLTSLGWSNRETYHDARNMIIYAQLTRDNRIAFGGRGAPYHFASRVKPEFDLHEEIHKKIIRSLNQVFKITQEVEITHRWGGPLGVPRDWRPAVNFDRNSGLGSLGGYVGDGVAASNLAARTMAHLILSDGHPLCELPWVNHPSRKWEVEPLRYLGINGLLRIAESIDEHEARTNQPDKFRTFIIDKFLGD